MSEPYALTPDTYIALADQRMSLTADRNSLTAQLASVIDETGTTLEGGAGDALRQVTAPHLVDQQNTFTASSDTNSENMHTAANVMVQTAEEGAAALSGITG